MHTNKKKNIICLTSRQQPPQDDDRPGGTLVVYVRRGTQTRRAHVKKKSRAASLRACLAYVPKYALRSLRHATIQDLRRALDRREEGAIVYEV